MFVNEQQELPEDYNETAAQQFAQLDDANGEFPVDVINEGIKSVFKDGTHFQDLVSIF